MSKGWRMRCLNRVGGHGVPGGRVRNRMLRVSGRRRDTSSDAGCVAAVVYADHPRPGPVLSTPTHWRTLAQHTHPPEHPPELPGSAHPPPGAPPEHPPTGGLWPSAPHALEDSGLAHPPTGGLRPSAPPCAGRLGLAHPHALDDPGLAHQPTVDTRAQGTHPL